MDMSNFRVLAHVISCSLILLAAQADAASFDCAKARSKVEKAICKDAELGKLDEQLSVAYKTALDNHPLPKYVRARQKDWLTNIQGCDAKEFVACLRKAYVERLEQLIVPKDIQVFANTQDFDYSAGDAVVEIVPRPGSVRFSVWGGFRMLRHGPAAEGANAKGKQLWFGCEFEGKLKGGGAQSAIGSDNSQVNFQIKGNKLVFEKGIDEKICVSTGLLPDEFTKF